jgi:hypothetical protein
VLTTTGVFSAHHPTDDSCDGEQLYALTPVSRLLVGPSNLNPLITMLLDTVGEVGLRKHHPRPATLETATFGLRTASVSWGNLRCMGANKNANAACAM